MADLPKPGIVLITSFLLALLSGCRSAPPPGEPSELVIRIESYAASGGPSVLYLDSESGSSGPRREPSLVDVASAGAVFRPPLSAVYAGDSVRFVNHGPLAHRIFTAGREGTRERALPPDGQSEALPITKLGGNNFYCSLHHEERLVVFASPSPFFVVADGAPVKRIDGVPPGQYRLRAWSETGLRFLATVEVRPGEAASHTIESL